MGLRVIVVINKMDRKRCRRQTIKTKYLIYLLIWGLRMKRQADFPIIYADGIKGKAGYTPELSENLQPLFQTILKKNQIRRRWKSTSRFKWLVSNIFYDEYRGLGVIGRIHRGKLKAGMNLSRIKPDDTIVPEKCQISLYLQRIEVK